MVTHTSFKMKNSTIMGRGKKGTYISPKITLHIIELENGIAVGSAEVRTTNTKGIIDEEWETGSDINGTYGW